MTVIVFSNFVQIFLAESVISSSSSFRGNYASDAGQVRPTTAEPIFILGDHRERSDQNRRSTKPAIFIAETEEEAFPSVVFAETVDLSLKNRPTDDYCRDYRLHPIQHGLGVNKNSAAEQCYFLPCFLQEKEIKGCDFHIDTEGEINFSLISIRSRLFQKPICRRLFGFLLLNQFYTFSELK